MRSCRYHKKTHSVHILVLRKHQHMTLLLNLTNYVLRAAKNALRPQLSMGCEATEKVVQLPLFDVVTSQPKVFSHCLLHIHRHNQLSQSTSRSLFWSRSTSLRIFQSSVMVRGAPRNECVSVEAHIACLFLVDHHTKSCNLVLPSTCLFNYRSLALRRTANPLHFVNQNRHTAWILSGGPLTTELVAV